MTPQQLRQISRTLVRQLGLLETRFGDLSLPPVQIHALIELDMEDSTVTELAEKLQIDKSNSSRTIANLAKQLLVETITPPDDKRCQIARLTPKGKAAIDRLNNHKNDKIQSVVDQMDRNELALLEKSLALYNKALKNVPLQKEFTIRPLSPNDNAALADVIRQVSAEYGLTADRGFSVADPTLDMLSEVYSGSQSNYWVIEHKGKVVGGAGIAPLSGEQNVCELQKMYFLPVARGKGLSRTLAIKCFDFAREQGFKQCYLETTEVLKEAITLYHNLGFELIAEALGNTGHTDCQVRMLRKL